MGKPKNGTPYGYTEAGRREIISTNWQNENRRVHGERNIYNKKPINDDRIDFSNSHRR
jgi:hypothetical protein